jgi:hypothetical protein
MIVCTMCGNHNDDASAFCGDCGRFLEWNGEKVAPPPEVVVVVEEPPKVIEKLTWWQRVRRRVTGWLPARVYVEKTGAPAAAAVATWTSEAEPPPPEPPKEEVVSGPPPPPPPPGRRAPAPPPPPPAKKAAPPPPPPPKKAAPAPKAAPPAPAGVGAASAGAAAPGAVKTVPPAPPAPKAAPPAPPVKAALPAPPVPAAPATPTERAVDPELVAALAQPVSGIAEARPAEPPELAPAPAIKKTRAIVRTKPTRRLEPDDLVCATCGEGNAPSRNFCSRCGESLADAGVVRLSWWRRLFRRRTKRFPAGTRPGQKGTREHRSWLAKLSLKRLRAVLVVLGLLFGLVYAVYPPFRNTVVDNVRAVYRKVAPTLDPVRPATVQTVSAMPDHDPKLLVDTYKDTYWAAQLGGDHPKVTFRFDESYLLRSVILHSGSANTFAEDGRPSILRLTYNTGRSENILPQDSSREQTLDLKNTSLVTTVTIEVVDVYSGTERQTVAISEIEFFALK